MNPPADARLPAMAQALAQSGDYRVLRRLVPRQTYEENEAKLPTKIGILLDVETTGLDTKADEVIELVWSSSAI